MLESKYQSDLIKKIRKVIEPDGYVLKLDSGYIQGLPDVLVIYKNRWGALECKRGRNDDQIQPNQEYYVCHLNALSFASFINPFIEDEVLNDLYTALRVRRSRSPQSK